MEYSRLTSVLVMVYTILTNVPTQAAPSASYSSNNEVGSTGDSYSQPNYKFQYGVYDSKYGNDYGHQEERNGHSTKGRYTVKLPDGRMQIVNYWADKNGYRAEVTYESTNSHDNYGSTSSNSGYNNNSYNKKQQSNNSHHHQQQQQQHHHQNERSVRSSFSTVKTKINGVYYGY